MSCIAIENTHIIVPIRFPNFLTSALRVKVRWAATALWDIFRRTGEGEWNTAVPYPEFLYTDKRTQPDPVRKWHHFPDRSSDFPRAVGSYFHFPLLDISLCYYSGKHGLIFIALEPLHRRMRMINKNMCATYLLYRAHTAASKVPMVPNMFY